MLQGKVSSSACQKCILERFCILTLLLEIFHVLNSIFVTMMDVFDEGVGAYVRPRIVLGSETNKMIKKPMHADGLI